MFLMQFKVAENRVPVLYDLHILLI